MTRGLVARLLFCALLVLVLPGWAPPRFLTAESPRLVAGQDAQPSAARLEEAYGLNNVGVAQLEQFDYAAAAATFGRALEAVPSLAIARVNLAIALLHDGRLDESGQAAQAAIAADPTAPQPHYVLGLVRRGNNQPEEAAAAFERVLSLDARDLGALVNLGQIRIQQQRYDEAITLLRRAVEAEPYHITAAYNLSVALTRGGRADDAARAVARFQELRASAYGTAFSNNYLERGRYAVALVSTGTEAGLVDEAVPEVAFVPTDIEHTPAGASARGGGRPAVTLADLDRDGDLDLIATGAAGTRLFLNDGTALVRVRQDAEPPWPAVPSSAAVVADYDNDHEPDIAVATAAGITLLRQARPGHFYDVGPDAGLGGVVAAATMALVDTDHDGDVDIVVGGAAPPARGGMPASSVRLFRNDGTGSFSDVTADAGLVSAATDVAVVPTDFDNRRDVDLLFVARDGAPRLMRNLRDGRFGDASAAMGLSPASGNSAVAAGDVNKDGFTDFFVATATDSRFELSDGTGTFRTVTGPAAAGGATAALMVDYDNDGVLDLVTAVSGGVRAWRNLGTRWQDVTERAVAAAVRPGSGAGVEAVAAGDTDNDGDVDLVVTGASGAVRLLRNDGGSRQPSLAVRLRGLVSNKSGVGASVELRAGSLWQKLEFTATSPAVAAADLAVGLGRRTAADVVRVLWPSGVLQAEAVAGRASRGALVIEELDRKPSSCPLLYTWTGRRFEFLTDFLGGGEMGYLKAPGVLSEPDPDEYVRIPGNRLVPRDGRLELRVTNELEEAVFLDRLQLIAVTHQDGTEVFPAVGLTAPPYRPFGLYVATALRAPARALDDRGRDVLDALRHVDRRFVDSLPLERIRGYARPHALTLDLGEADGVAPAPGGGRTLLVLTGWTDYAFSSDNLAAHQAGLSLQPPSLQVRDGRGAWHTVVPEVGVPVGRPQAVVVDLTGKFLSASREVRIVTTMRVYWDQAAVDTSGRATYLSAAELEGGGGVSLGVTFTRLEPSMADLSWRGFSRGQTIGGLGPLDYDYDDVSVETPWKLMPGRYTREGDVRPLLGVVDDMFVVSRPGDEVRVAFDAAALAAPGPGTTRTYLLFAHGYSKEMDLSSSSPDQVAPLPFRGMTRYPYAPPERYPDTPAHRAYLETFNTRVVGRMVAPLVAREPRGTP